MKQFTSVQDILMPERSLSQSIDALVEKALDYKANPRVDQHLGKDKRIGLVFLNPSLRTRMSTQVAAEQLGMMPIVFNIGSEGWSWELEDGAVMNGTSVEHIKDAVPVLSSYFDVLAIRTFPGLKDKAADYGEAVLQAFIKYSSVPVISLESATLHPLQSLADMITIKELALKRKPKVLLCWAPHIKPLPQCVANSFAQWANAWDAVELSIAHPKGYELSAEFAQDAPVYDHLEEALKDADFVYFKNWSAFEDYGAMPAVDGDWMMRLEQLKLTNDAKLMHCLPVRRNVEVSDEILDSENSIVTKQAANRVWSAQVILSEILKANHEQH